MRTSKATYFALLLLSCSVAPLLAQGGGAKGSPAKDKPPDYGRWNNTWILTCRYESAASVAVTMTGLRTKTPLMTAKFITGSEEKRQGGLDMETVFGIPHRHQDGECTIGSGAKFRDVFLWAKVTGSQLKGKIYFCTTDRKLAEANNLTAQFECDFDGTFNPETDKITGSAKSED